MVVVVVVGGETEVFPIRPWCCPSIFLSASARQLQLLLLQQVDDVVTGGL